MSMKKYTTNTCTIQSVRWILPRSIIKVGYDNAIVQNLNKLHRKNMSCCHSHVPKVAVNTVKTYQLYKYIYKIAISYSLYLLEISLFSYRIWHHRALFPVSMTSRHMYLRDSDKNSTLIQALCLKIIYM